MTDREGHAKGTTGQQTAEDREVRVSWLTPAEIAARFSAKPRSTSWRINRARNRALGVDRFGRPLPRVAGTNPRARRDTDAA